MTPAIAPCRSPLAHTNGFTPRAGFRPFNPADAESTLGARFRETALRRGNAIALVDGGARISYADLLLRAETIAATLRSRWGGAGGIVGICLPSGLPTIEAMLGALAGGFGYFCADPSLPTAQIAGLLEAAAPLTVLGDAPADGKARGVRAADTRGPGGTAAMYATSGSTGEPKIVALPHRAVLFDIGRQTNDLCLGPDDRFDSLFSSAFSASLATVFGALLNGAELHHHDPRHQLTGLFDWLAERRITISTMTVSMLRHICMARRSRPGCPSLRLLSVSGEALKAGDVEMFRSVFGASCVLQNAMASTETRTYAQYFVPGRGPVENPVPIGWPVAGKAVTVMDETGAPVPEGGEGEIVVRSRYIATSYANDPRRTAEKFQIQPDGTIRYRTGDRGRLRADGSLVFLGRTDSQVKVRGHRVELGAIAQAIESHPAVRNAVVVRREDAGGHGRLVAYVAPREDTDLTEGHLRGFLRERLPAYAVPAAFVFLPELP
ncbi:MAG TPA: AMP-binding protein [Bryobacteraceae bacterium]|nr:AMP-binding protein [Bryobacteraceae bacterium]